MSGGNGKLPTNLDNVSGYLKRVWMIYRVVCMVHPKNHEVQDPSLFGQNKNENTKEPFILR